MAGCGIDFGLEFAALMRRRHRHDVTFAVSSKLMPSRPQTADSRQPPPPHTLKQRGRVAARTPAVA